MKRTETEVKTYFDKAPKDDKREFMIYVTENVPREYQGYCRELFFGHSINVIKSGNDKCPHYKRLKDMGITNYSEIFGEEREDV